MAEMQLTLRNRGPSVRSIWMLGGLNFRELVRNVLHDAQKNELLERASGLAFDFLFALFPLLFILLAIFNLFAHQSLQLRISLLAYFADLLPSLAFQLLNRTAAELAATRSAEKLTAGILLGLWFISGGVAAIISSLNAAFRIEESRSWFKVRAIGLALTGVISVLILTALAIVLVSGDFVDWMANVLHTGHGLLWVWKALQWPTAMAFVIFSYALIYHFGPNLPDKRWYWITPGSLFAATSWMIASVGFRFYLEYVNNYTVIFGSLGAAVILLVWLYVTGLAFLLGGEINATIERAATQQAESGSRFLREADTAA